jgi:predicted KAP-like P-loop ATPase
MGKKLVCPLCHKDDDTQEHLFSCEKITTNESSNTFNYEYIFSSTQTENILAACTSVATFSEESSWLSQNRFKDYFLLICEGNFYEDLS